MSASIGSINSIVSSVPIAVTAQKEKVADTLKTTPAIQQPSNPAAIVTLDQPSSQETDLYNSLGVTGKPSSHVVYGTKIIANSPSSTSAPTTQLTAQNVKQLQNYSAIQEIAAIHQSAKSGTRISFLS